MGKDNNCLQLSFCCVTGLHPFDVEFIDPARPDFWPAWRAEARRLGFQMIYTREGRETEKYLPLFEAGPLWIAGVPSLFSRSDRYNHAIVMQGADFYYDCNAKPYRRTRRPSKIEYAMAVLPK